MEELVAITICNYNLPKETDNIVEYIKSNFKIPHILCVVDNGSTYKSKYTTDELPVNLNKLPGVLVGMRKLEKYKPSAYWNISTSTQFLPFNGDACEELLKTLRGYENAISISPGYVGEVIDVTNKVNLAIENSIVHEADLVGVYSMFDARWLESIGFFEPRLTSTFGTDFETAYLAKKQGKKMLVHDKVRVDVTKGKVYKLGLGQISLEEYQQRCRLEMETVLTEKYGKGWRKVLGVEKYV